MKSSFVAYRALRSLILSVLFVGCSSPLVAVSRELQDISTGTTFVSSAAFDGFFSIVPAMTPRIATGQYSRDPAKSTGGTWLSNGEVAVDWNGDGLTDYIDGGSVYPSSRKAADYRAIKLRILINKGDGQFEDQADALIRPESPSRYNFSECVTADFNGDGRPDLFCVGGGADVPPYGGEKSVYLLSAPDGKWDDRSATLPSVTAFGHYAAIGRINGDGVPHILVLNICGGTEEQSYFLMNDRKGNLTPDKSRIPPSMQSNCIRYITAKFADLDGDGFDDLVLGAGHADASGGKASSDIIYNDRRGSFTSTPSPLPPGCFSDTNTIVPELQIADIDNDGKPDILLSATQGNPFYVGGCIQALMNKGQRVFVDETASRIWRQPGAWVTRINVIDVNNDGFVDIVPALAATHTYMGGTCTLTAPCIADGFILLNNGAAKFLPPPFELPRLLESWDQTRRKNYSGPFALREREGAPVSLVMAHIGIAPDSTQYLQYSMYLPTSPLRIPSDSSRIFNWAESVFPSFFPKGAVTDQGGGYTYRYYPSTKTYLATKNGRVIVHNGAAWNLLDVGAVDDYLRSALSSGF